MSSGLSPAVMAAVVALFLVAGCAATPERTKTELAFPIARSLYTVTGRLSARHGAEGLSANFQWRHDHDRDELELSSPLGQTVARLMGDAGGVHMITADGRVESANDWQTLTTRGLGWPLPVAGLAYWVQGAHRLRHVCARCGRRGAAFTGHAQLCRRRDQACDRDVAMIRATRSNVELTRSGASTKMTVFSVN